MIDKKSLWLWAHRCVCWIHWLASSALLITLSATISSPNTDRCYLTTLGSKFSLKQWQLLTVLSEIKEEIPGILSQYLHMGSAYKTFIFRRLFIAGLLSDGKELETTEMSLTRVSTQLWSIFIMKYNACCWKWIRQYCIQWKQASGSLMGRRSPTCDSMCCLLLWRYIPPVSNSRPTQSLSPNHVTLL